MSTAYAKTHIVDISLTVIYKLSALLRASAIKDLGQSCLVLLDLQLLIRELCNAI